MAKRRKHIPYDKAFSPLQKCINAAMINNGELEKFKYILKMYGVDYTDELVAEIKRKANSLKKSHNNKEYEDNENK